MGTSFRPYSPDQALLLPASLNEWLAEGHLAYFISDVVEELDLSAFYARYEGDGRRKSPFDPRRMLKVLIYAYANGVFSSVPDDKAQSNFTDPGTSLWWHVQTRNKRSVALDLRSEEGQALARQLAAEADVVVENFRPGTLDNWGLGWEALSALNPRLIMVHISGYGQTGPYRDKPGLGVIGREDLANDPALAHNDGRSQQAAMIDDAIQAWTEERPRDAILQALDDARVPAGYPYTAEDIAHDPHYLAREMIQTFTRPNGKPLKVPGVLPKLSATPGRLGNGGPTLGQHKVMMCLMSWGSTTKPAPNCAKRASYKESSMSHPTPCPVKVEINEVAPRDGLQIEARFVPTEEKIRWIDALSTTGLRRIEATSFTSPKAIPNLRDAADVVTGLQRREGVDITVLVPNVKGTERALACQVDEINLVMSASESHGLANLRMTPEQSLEQFAAILEVSQGSGVFINASLSTTFGCPFEGEVPEARALELTKGA